MLCLKRLRGAGVLMAASLLVACTDDPVGPMVPEPVEPAVPGAAAALVPADEAGSDLEALHFLPPLMPVAAPAELDGTLLDWVALRVCWEVGDACEPVAVYDAGSPGPGRVRLSARHYHGGWDTRGAGPGVYRLAVAVAGLDLGALALAVDGRGRIWNPQTGAPLGRVGRTLPVMFRIEPDPAVRARVMTAAGAGAVAIAEQLAAEFGSHETEVARLLHGEGFDGDATGEALKTAFPEAPPEVAGTAMLEAGYDGVDVARALYDWWLANSLVVVPVLDAFGLTPEDVAYAIASVYEYSAEQLAQTLAEAEWAVDKVVQGVTYVYDNPDEVVLAMVSAGVWTLEQIVWGVDQATDWTEETIARALQRTGISPGDAMAALRYVFGLGVEAMLALAEATDWTSNQITAGLNAAYDLSAEGLATVLKAAGWTADKISDGMEYAGYAASEIGDVLDDLFDDLGDAWCDNVGWWC